MRASRRASRLNLGPLARGDDTEEPFTAAMSSQPVDDTLGRLGLGQLRLWPSCPKDSSKLDIALTPGKRLEIEPALDLRGTQEMVDEGRLLPGTQALVAFGVEDDDGGLAALGDELGFAAARRLDDGAETVLGVLEGLAAQGIHGDGLSWLAFLSSRQYGASPTLVHQASGTARGRRSSSMATRVKRPSVT